MENLKLEKREKFLKDKGFKTIENRDLLKGTHELKWYFKNAADPGSPREYQSRDSLVLKEGFVISRATKNVLNHQHHYGQNFLSPIKNNGKVLS